MGNTNIKGRVINIMVNKFTKEFIIDFCLEDGSIDWEKLVKFNSESKSLL
ncbi:hypothetical protein EZS27_005713 [termite gut metagenome]|uniref:Uncharacterized protein n=1 Tax=termite gut metagenome TaxID=433724 RepID=A0A5J4SNH9_9ZZZZ